MSIADQVAPVGRADLEVKVDRVVLAGQAPIKRGSLVVLSKVARGASRRTARRTANSSTESHPASSFATTTDLRAVRVAMRAASFSRA